MLFFLAGYETTATSLTFTLYLLASNERTQRKLCGEIWECLNESEVGADLVRTRIKNVLRMSPAASV